MKFGGALAKVHKAIRRRFMQRGIILMYHRVASGMADPWQLCVSAQNFEQHMGVLRRLYQPVRLDQLASGPAIRNRMVAVTFDDGYADNLHDALPILQHHEIPATFFLTSGTLGGAREFWWDELEHLLMRAQSLPRTLQVTVGTVSRAFEAGRAAEPFEDSARHIQSHPPWEAAPDTRLGFYYTVWQWLGALTEEARHTALAQIRNQLGEPDIRRDSHRTLTPEEAIRLAGAPQIDIGAHSVTHGRLSTQPPDVQRWEMRQSKEDLEALIDRPVTAFAYPHGDYAPETLEIARESGFEFACTVERGCVAGNTQPFLLPRLSVGDFGGAQLVRYLEAVL
jgi:peptidoglycan/xylan/chitin deacetylase (PgdA/CDA1 family)